MSGPKVYEAIVAVAAELARTGIPKSQTNAEDQYRFRGIDQVYACLSPALAKHHLCILPRVLERSCQERAGVDGSLLFSVTVHVAYELVSSDDGSRHIIEAFGEALDCGDKGTSKAITAAFKYAVFQAFCIPVSGNEDADQRSHKLAQVAFAEPVQGWEQWTRDIADVARACETGEALDRLQNTNRSLLRILSNMRPELYNDLGQAIRARRFSIGKGQPQPDPKQKPKRSVQTRRTAEAKRESRGGRGNGKAVASHA